MPEPTTPFQRFVSLAMSPVDLEEETDEDLQRLAAMPKSGGPDPEPGSPLPDLEPRFRMDHLGIDVGLSKTEWYDESVLWIVYRDVNDPNGRNAIGFSCWLRYRHEDFVSLYRALKDPAVDGDHWRLPLPAYGTAMIPAVLGPKLLELAEDFEAGVLVHELREQLKAEQAAIDAAATPSNTDDLTSQGPPIER